MQCACEVWPVRLETAAIHLGSTASESVILVGLVGNDLVNIDG